MAIEGGALKANITAIRPLVLPTWDELLFVLLLPPAASLLKLITAMKLKLRCCLFSSILLAFAGNFNYWRRTF